MTTPIVLDDEFDELYFPKATVSPKLLKLQSDTTEFVTGVILNHETKFYELANTLFTDMESKIELLGVTAQQLLSDDTQIITNKKIIDMITLTTNTYYNQLYFSIQKKQQTPLTELINEMSTNGKYGPHIMLDKLIRLTIDIHLDIIREDLCLDTLDLYLKTVLKQINTYLLSANLLHSLSKGPNDDIPFCIVPDGAKPFNITSKIVFQK